MEGARRFAVLGRFAASQTGLVALSRLDQRKTLLREQSNCDKGTVPGLIETGRLTGVYVLF